MTQRRIFTWKFTGDVPLRMSPYDVMATIRYSLHEWEKVCFVGFSQDYTGDVDITFQFGTMSRPEHAAEHIAKGSRHFVTFNKYHKWRVHQPGFGGWLKRIFSSGSKDLLTFSLHEVGHVLGLVHVDPNVDQMSVMVPYPEAEGYVTSPSKRDGMEVRKIYPLPWP